MSELALRLIQQAKEERWLCLDLGNCGITELPESLFELTWLEALNLGENVISWKGFVGNGFQRKEKNMFTCLPNGFRYLNGLTHLDCLGVPLKDIDVVQALTELEYLDVSQTSISDLTPLTELKSLKSLSFSSTEVSNLTPISGLVKLEVLCFDCTNVHDLSPLTNLSSLEAIFFYENPITDLQPLSTLTQLKGLHFASTPVHDLQPIWYLKELRSLSLGGKINKFPRFILQLEKLEGLELLGCSVGDIPDEFHDIEDEAHCLSNVRNWFKALERGEVLNNEVKIVLIGNGTVGKSSLMERLLYDSFAPGLPSTHGIEIDSWSISLADDSQVKTWFWDFGGQDIYHATHRLFLRTKALFLLVWDAETEQRHRYAEEIGGTLIPFQHEPLAYWLEYTWVLGDGSPVIVVQNKTDRDGEQYASRDLQEKYPNLKFFRNVSAATGRGLSQLKETMVETLAEMPELQQKMPESWYNARAQVRVLSDKQISVARFTELCTSQGVPEEEVPTLLYFFHETGVFFHRKGIFHDQIILDQQWAINAVYTLFDREKVYHELLGKQGRFTLAYLQQRAWQEFSKEECELFISFMESCEICFCLDSPYDPNATYLAPALLPKTRPSVIHFAPADLYFQYRHQFLHSALIQRFIVRTGRLSKQHLLWRNGIELSWDGNEALVEARPDDKTINILVRGPQAQLLLDLIRKEFDNMHEAKQFVTEWVSVDGKRYVDLKVLRDYTQEIDWDKVPDEHNKPVLIKDLTVYLQAPSEFTQTLYEINQTQMLYLLCTRLPGIFPGV
ncbi:internalin A [Catalinimonas alkaloidigena]|uniref:Internalin A n=1 Tax=Catalinimonas alkaloidigena TaxID=1075417 RepID=A0A1G9G7Q9_9BACT|nr:COR domain-containing protein [Catalinimonas alkaloidigena]SDK96627.1 internalin A [Catalinimonas alkaloidigena]